MTAVIKRNYVNCKLEGYLPEDVFKELRIKMRYSKPGYRFSYVYKQGWGDGYVYLITPKRRVFPSGLLHIVEGHLQAHNIPYTIEDLRTEPALGESIELQEKKLRDYQQEMFEACIKHRSGVIRAATGAGKTLVMAKLMGHFNGLKRIIYVRKLDLMRQTIKVLTEELGIPIGQIGGGQIDIQDLSVVMIPTAARALGEKYIKYTGHDNDDEDDNTPFSIQQKQEVKEYIENTECTITDECFVSGTRILTEDGWKAINWLVNNKYEGQVWSYNIDEARMELKPVTNWFKRSTSTPLCRVKLHNTKRRDCVTCTENHKFYTINDQQIEAKNLYPGIVVKTFISEEKHGKLNNSSKTRRALNDDQLQVALGTVLGDGYLYLYPSKKAARLQWTHCKEQEDYLKWKLSIFGCEDKIRTQKGGYGNRSQKLGRTYGWYQLKSLYADFYSNGVKRITRNVLNRLAELGLAVWFMDDGTWDKKSDTYILCTNSFTFAEQEVIQRYLSERWNIQSIIRFDKRSNSHFLYIRKESTDLIKSLIAPYVHPSMRYKGNLVGEHKEINKQFLSYGLVEILEVEHNVTTYRTKKDGTDLVYNITVDDNHNYIANGFLVSNCHALASESCQMIHKHSKKAYYRYGFSATPHRTDGTDILIHAATGSKIYDLPASTLIERGFLVPPRVHFYRVPRDWKIQVPNDFQKVYSEFIVENELRNKKIIALTKHLVEHKERLVILVQRQQHGKDLEQALLKEGLVAKFIYGKSSMTERVFTLGQFEDGVLDVLIGSTILNEGIDVPCITALINAAGGKSSSAYYQKIGRAIRTHEDKTRAIVIDFIDNVKWLEKHSKARIKVLETEPLYQIKVQGKD